MTEEEKIYLYELNQTYTDGFTRGYNRGFLDGIHMRVNIRNDEKIMDMLREEDDD